jgi:hypothetical protein
MRVYSALQEENIRDGNLVQEWTKSGLLDPMQNASLQAELNTELRRTNGFLRAVFWVFASLVAIASVALLLTIFKPNEEMEWAMLFLPAGLTSWAIAEIACSMRLYRYGIEEAFIVISVVLISLGVSQIFGEQGRWSSFTGFLVASLGGLAVYYRFGFVYAAVGAIAAFAALPFQFHLPDDMERLLSAILIGVALVFVRAKRKSHTDEPAGSGLDIVEAAAWLVIYLVLNLKLEAVFFGVRDLRYYSPDSPPLAEDNTWFYILSWATIWILPIAALRYGLLHKDRLLIEAGVLMGLLTLMSNKRYLGWTMYSWDPMVLGTFLMLTAILIRRWLQRGVNGERSGFTALRLLQGDERKLAAVGIASAVLQPQPSDASTEESSSEFRGGGGLSGGGGAGGTF